jgi:hypothetical protein
VDKQSDPDGLGDFDAHQRKVILFTVGTGDKLRRMGLIEGGAQLTEQGQLEFEKLKATGFEPTKEEIRECLLALASENDDA